MKGAVMSRSSKLAYDTKIPFNYSLDSFVHVDGSYEDVLKVTYVVEGDYIPIYDGSFDKDASDDFEYQGRSSEDYAWYIVKVINRTDEREVIEAWWDTTDVHDMIVVAFEKEHKAYFEKDVDTDFFEC